MNSAVETVVMDVNTPVHVASNHPGQEPTMVKDAVPPVQTAASKIKKVKKTLFLKRETNFPIFSFLSFYRQRQLHPRISSTNERKMPCNSTIFDNSQFYFKTDL